MLLSCAGQEERSENGGPREESLCRKCFIFFPIFMRLGANQKKILLVLTGTLTLLCTAMPSRQFRIVRIMRKEWRKIDRENLTRSLQALEKKRLLQWKKEGKYFVPVLTRVGRKLAEIYRMGEMSIHKPKVWDGRWRLVLFDVPEKEKETRDYFRRQLKRLNFFEFQKSVFVTPYDCRRKMRKISESFQGGKAIRYIEATYLDNAKELKKHFDLR